MGIAETLPNWPRWCRKPLLVRHPTQQRHNACCAKSSAQEVQGTAICKMNAHFVLRFQDVRHMSPPAAWRVARARDRRARARGVRYIYDTRADATTVSSGSNDVQRRRSKPPIRRARSPRARVCARTPRDPTLLTPTEIYRHVRPCAREQRSSSRDEMNFPAWGAGIVVVSFVSAVAMVLAATIIYSDFVPSL